MQPKFTQRGRWFRCAPKATLHRQNLRRYGQTRGAAGSRPDRPRPGKLGDRVATLAWNGYRHLELYYAISGSGGVCHTINPRLSAEQMTYIVNHANDTMLFVDLTFVPIVDALRGQWPAGLKVVVMTDRAHMPEGDYLCYEELLEGQSRALRLARSARRHRRRALLHLRHHRQPKGHALHAPLHCAARHDGRPLAACCAATGQTHPAGGAAFPRERLGLCLMQHPSLAPR